MIIRMYRIYCIALLSFSSLGGTLLASVYLLPDYVVTPTRFEQKPEDLSPSVSYFSSDALAQAQYVNLTDALNQFPGIFLVSNGGMGKVTSLFARGSESNHTTLLINGRRLPSGFSGQYDLGQLGLVNASSVEMVRGDVSALYGGGSIAGTVNIRTDRANYGTAQSLSTELGRDDFSHAQYSYNYGGNDYSLSLGLESTNTNGYQPNSAFERVGLNAFYTRSLTDVLDFDLQVYGYDSKIGVPGSTISNTWHTYPSAEINKTQTRLISPRLNLKLSENASLSALFSNAENELQSIQNGGNDNVYNEKLRSFESQYMLVDKDKNKHFLLGLIIENKSYTQEPINGSSASSKKFGYNSKALYAQSVSQVDALTSLKINGRLADYSRHFDTARTGAIELSRALDSTGTKKLFLKKSFGNTPPEALDIVYVTNFDSIDWNLETVRSLEIGYRQKLNGNWDELGFVAFKNKLFDIADGNPNGGGFFDSKQNGFESYVMGRLLDSLRFNFAYTYLDAQVTISGSGAWTGYTEGNQLVRRPMHKLNASLGWDVNDALQLGANFYAGINREDSTGGQRFEDMSVLRVYGNLKLNETCSLHARLENALNESYEWTSGYPGAPISFYLGGSLSF
jgi:outer membrane cobalamin receptor